MGLWEELGLDMERHRLTAAVGGGGKTTALYALAREAVCTGRTAVVTTTTHIAPHPFLPLARSSAELSVLLPRSRLAVLGRREGGKLSAAAPPEALSGLADVVLVEADGARSRPLKAPAPHEPVIPPGADAVVAVAGLDALGRAVGEVCHRPERVCALLGVDERHTVTPGDVARILASPLGARKSAPPGAAFRCLLNKADTSGLRAGGEEIQRLLARQGILAAIHSFSEEERGGNVGFNERSGGLSHRRGGTAAPVPYGCGDDRPGPAHGGTADGGLFSGCL